MRVKNYYSSDLFASTKGVLQGDILKSPNLFKVFINDVKSFDELCDPVKCLLMIFY